MNALLLSSLLALAAPIEADVVLKNATLVDGSGNPAQVGDLAIRGDRIVGIGKFDVAGAPKVLDCTGLIVAPGFIDLHTHSDYPLQKSASAPNLNYLMQGVTTAVTGNCGAGPIDVAGYFKTLEVQGVGTNVIHQVPHNDVRKKVMGNANRAPTEEELAYMQRIVDQGMRDGAFGMATGLIYNPGTYSKTDELIALAQIVARAGGLYASHIRDENTGILVAMDEILTIARKAGLRVHISHIKVSGRTAWGKAPDVITLLRQARKDGVQVTADQYPYTASSTSLTATVIPAKYREGSEKDLIARLDDPKTGPDLIQAIEKKLAGGKHIKVAGFGPEPTWQGLDIATIAAKMKKSPVEIAVDITRRGGASIVNFGMNEEEVRLFMKEPWVATASDGRATVPDTTVPHPRSYGTFPRKIGLFSIEEKLIPVEQAIRSASGLPADILKLSNRGYLKVGQIADVVALDPKTFRDTATFDRPHQYATGVRHLYVNGQAAIAEGRYTGAMAGKVIRWGR